VQGILYFRRSADWVNNPGGQVTTYRQVKGSPSLLRRAAAITLSGDPVYWHEGGDEASPGFSGELRVRLVGSGGRYW
jgi:hypothetical protein